MPVRDLALARGYAKFPTPYDTKALGLGPIAYWALDDLIGTTAVDSSINANDGSYINAAGFELGQPGIGDRSRSVLFNEDGDLNGYCNIYSAGLSSVFNGAEGSHGIWARILNAGVWTDGATRYMIHNYVDGSNRMYIAKRSSNIMRRHFQAGGTSETGDNSGQSDLGWVHWLHTWSAANDQVRLYKNGIELGVTSTGIGTWSGGALHGSFNKISTTQGTVGEWRGWLAKGVIFDRVLTAAEILTLGTVRT